MGYLFKGKPANMSVLGVPKHTEKIPLTEQGESQVLRDKFGSCPKIVGATGNAA